MITNDIASRIPSSRSGKLGKGETHVFEEGFTGNVELDLSHEWVNLGRGRAGMKRKK